MQSGSRVVVRRIGEHMVVIDPTRDTIEVRRSNSNPTPDDTLLAMYGVAAVRRVEFFMRRDGSHRLILAVGSREGIDLGAEVTNAQGLDLGKKIARCFEVTLDIRDGDYLEAYFRDNGPILSRIHDGRQMIDAVIVDPVDPFDEVSPWEGSDEIGYQSVEPDGVSMDQLVIEIRANPTGKYDDGPFAQPGIRTAPGVEAVYPLLRPIDPPPMSAEAKAEVRARKRSSRKRSFERCDALAWLRGALKALSA